MTSPIQTLIIPQYLLRVTISEARQAKYYKRKEYESGKVPKSKTPKVVLYDRNDRLLDRHGKPIISNARVAGKPKYEKISGNAITYGSQWRIRAIKNQLIASYWPHIRAQLRPFKPEELPLRISWAISCPVDIPNFDLDNLWPYRKYLLDCLKYDKDPVTGQAVTPIIPDDSVQYITGAPGGTLVPVANEDLRAFEFRFYRDERSIINNHNLWNP